MSGRKPWDRCRVDGRLILSKSGYTLCRKHDRLDPYSFAPPAPNVVPYPVDDEHPPSDYDG